MNNSTPKEFKSFFKRVQGNEGDKCHYPTRLDTYGCGCAHDCSYCYAKSLLEFRKLWNPSQPAVASIIKIKHTIDRQLKAGDVVRLGGMTDCLQPAETIYHITRETIKLLNAKGVHYLIVTKSALIASDEMLEVLDPRLAHIQVSVTSTYDAIAQRMEHASRPSARIKAIEKLCERGFDVAMRLSPFIPEFYDLEKINAVRVKKVIVEFLRVNSWIKQWFPIDYSEYTLKQSNYAHLSLEAKLAYISKIKIEGAQVSVCEDVSEHYDYWRKNFNPNPDDCCNLTIRNDE